MIPALNYIDLVLAIVGCAAIFHAYHKGFIDSFIEITIWLGSFLATLFISEYVIVLLAKFNISGIWVRPMFFVILLVGFSRLIFVLTDKLSASVPDEIHFHWSNKAAGIFPGLFSGAIYASLISFFFLSYSLGDVSRKARESVTVNLLTKPSEWPGEQISNILSEIGYKLGSNFTVYPKGIEIVYLPYKTSEFRVRKDLGNRMLDLINQEREKVNLPPLSSDEEIEKVALDHSRDMLERGYFAHYTPEGKSPFDRIRKARVRFIIAGENLALARTLELAHEGLMGSPGHKANILNPSFGRVGLGILDAGSHGIMVTQNFRN